MADENGNQTETVDDQETNEDTEAQELLADAASEQEQSSESGESDEVARLKKALNKANKDGERQRKRLKEYEDRDKTEQQKLQERAETAEKTASDLEVKLTRAEVAAEKGLTAKQAGRLQGSTREELEADADELLSEFPTSKPQAPDLKQGQRGDPNKSRQLSREEVKKMTSAEIEAAREKGQLDDLMAGRSKG